MKKFESHYYGWVFGTLLLCIDYSKANVWWGRLPAYPEVIYAFSRHSAELEELGRRDDVLGFMLRVGVYGFLGESMALQHCTFLGETYKGLGGHGLDLHTYDIIFDRMPRWELFGFSFNAIRGTIRLYQRKGRLSFLRPSHWLPARLEHLLDAHGDEGHVETFWSPTYRRRRAICGDPYIFMFYNMFYN